MSSAGPWPAGPPPAAVCYRHPRVAAPVTCRRCERPICTNCMVSAPVGWQCPSCVKDAPPVRRLGELPVLERPVLTVGIIGACAVAYLATAAGGGVNDFSLVPVFVGAGEWWRLITVAFLHANLIHILFNMLILYQLGTVLETQFGRLRFAALYGASLLGGSLGVVLLSDPYQPTVGASGAVFGLMGAVVVLPRDRLNPFGASIGGLLVLNLGITFLVPGISIGGHLGGLATGLACGGILRLLRRVDNAKWIGAGACLLIGLACFVGALAVADASTPF